MTRYGNNLKNTADYVDELLSEYVKVPRTPFDNRNRIILDTTPYAIVPFDVWEMLPNSDAYLDYDLSIISKIPTVKRLLSGMTAEVRVYKVNYNDCWEGWNNFITKGRSGKVSKSIPYLEWSLGDSGNTWTTCLPYNPYSYLGIAPAAFIAKNSDTAPTARFSFFWNSKARVNDANVTQVESSTLTGIDTIAKLKASTAMRVSALPAVFYNKVVKQFINPNILQDNPHWYPENENHDMLLPYSTSSAVTTSDYDNPTMSVTTAWSYSGADENKVMNPSVEKDSSDNFYSYPWLNVLQYADRKADYFTTGSPFPDLIRGDVPTLQVLNAQLASNVIRNLTPGRYDSMLVPSTAPIGSPDPLYSGDPVNVGIVPGLNIPGIITTGGTDYLNYLKTLRFSTNEYEGSQIPPTYELSDTTINGINFSMNQWRYLATLTVMRERLALTDGSYNEMIKSMFGHNPKWHNHEPQYCGGFTQPLVFSEVVNTAESDSAPLGDTAGRAVSASQHPTIHVHSDDFGMFMSVLVIKPDEYYCQGVDKMWSRLENAEQYFPILNNLAPDATKNKEIYVSGNNTDDEDVFNHQERFAYYKSRRNRIAGLLAMPASLVSDVSAFVMKRLFGNTPQFNAQFVRGQLTSDEKSVFAGVSQAEFNVVIGSRFKYVGPIPRNTRPSDMGISY